MKLADCIKAKGRSITSVAKEWGIPVSSLTRAMNGQRWPTPTILVRAHEFSNGKVKLADWIETCRPFLREAGVINQSESE